MLRLFSSCYWKEAGFFSFKKTVLRIGSTDDGIDIRENKRFRPIATGGIRISMFDDDLNLLTKEKITVINDNYFWNITNDWFSIQFNCENVTINW